MDLVMTLSDSEDGADGAGAGSSDDEDFEMGGEIGGDMPDPSASGKWKTDSARSNLKKPAVAMAPPTLDAKLAERASKKQPDNAPPLTAADAASDLKERRQSRKETLAASRRGSPTAATRTSGGPARDGPTTSLC